MLTPMSIMSLNQGREMALWHIGRFYADGPALSEEPGYAQTVAEPATPTEQVSEAECHSNRSFWAAFWRRLRSASCHRAEERTTA